MEKECRRRSAYLYSAQWLVIKARQEAEARERKTRRAWLKRQFNRTRGPYRDPIKALIRERQAETMRRRRGGAGGPSGSSEGQGLNTKRLDYPALLQRMREMHRFEARTGSEEPLIV
jgi:hypothetical protein